MRQQVFDPIELGWDGREYTIPPHKVMGAIHRIERFVTLDQLGKYAEQESAPLGLIASAYAAVLRYAGARVSDSEVYGGMFEGDIGLDTVMTALETLMAMMLPPHARRQLEIEGNKGGEVSEDDAENPSQGGSSSSNRLSDSASEKDGSAQNNSGSSTPKNSGGSTRRKRPRNSTAT